MRSFILLMTALSFTLVEASTPVEEHEAKDPHNDISGLSSNSTSNLIPSQFTKSKKPIIKNEKQVKPLNLPPLTLREAYNQKQVVSLYKHYGFDGTRGSNLMPYANYGLGNGFSDKIYTLEDFMNNTELGQWARDITPISTYRPPYDVRRLLQFLATHIGDDFPKKLAEYRHQNLFLREFGGMLTNVLTNVLINYLQRQHKNLTGRSKVFWKQINTFAQTVGGGLKQTFHDRKTQMAIAKLILLLTSLYFAYTVLKWMLLPSKPVIIKEQRLSWRWWRAAPVRSYLDKLHYNPGVHEWIDAAVKRDKAAVLGNKKRAQFNFYSLLLYGKPGTGKTALAKAYAAVCDFDYLHISGSSWAQLGVEDGLKNFKETLRLLAGNPRPVVCFIDEVDSVFRKRGGDAQQTALDLKLTNEFLAQINEAGHPNIKFIFATNLPEKLDEAFLSRISEKIRVAPPSPETAKAILNTYLTDFCEKYALETEASAFDVSLPEGITGRAIKQVVGHAVEMKALEGQKSMLATDLTFQFRSVDRSTEQVDPGINNCSIRGLEEPVAKSTAPLEKDLFKGLIAILSLFLVLIMGLFFWVTKRKK